MQVKNAQRDSLENFTEGFPGALHCRTQRTCKEHCGLSSVEESPTPTFKLQAMTIYWKQQHRKQSEARVGVSTAKRPARSNGHFLVWIAVLICAKRVECSLPCPVSSSHLESIAEIRNDKMIHCRDQKREDSAPFQAGARADGVKKKTSVDYGT